MPNLLDVDPTILEKNLLLKEFQDDSTGDSLFNIKPQDTENIPWKPVKPHPGYCLKLRTQEGDKVFVNVCHTDGIPEPVEISEEKLLQMIMDDDVPSFRIPISIGDLHIESDKAHNPCSVYDIAVNSKFFKKMDSSEVFNTFFLNVSIQALQEKYSLNLDLKSEKPFLLLKNRKVLGNLQIHRIQQREVKKAPGQLIQEIDSKPITGNIIIEEIKSDNKTLENADKLKSKRFSNEILSSNKINYDSMKNKESNDNSNSEKNLMLQVTNHDRSQSSDQAIEEKGIHESTETKDNLSKESHDNKCYASNLMGVSTTSNSEQQEEQFQSPKDSFDRCTGLFCLKQYPENGHPKLLVASTHLNVKSSRDFDLELDENKISITLIGSKRPWFDVILPYNIDVNKVEALFITETQRLMIKMDVI